MKKKIISILIIYILMINIVLSVYADDENSEKDISEKEMEEIIETAADLSEIPEINSRNAVVYDRTSRQNLIW